MPRWHVATMLAAVVALVGCVDGAGDGSLQCDQECRDQAVAFGIQWSVMSVFNAITGTTGDVDVQVDCTYAGSAGVTGSVEVVEDDLLRSDLTFALERCEQKRTEEYALELTGDVDQVGEFRNGGGFVEFAYDSDLVAFHGTATPEVGGTIEAEDTCALQTTLACDDDGACLTAGTLCDRDFEPLPSTASS